MQAFFRVKFSELPRALDESFAFVEVTTNKGIVGHRMPELVEYENAPKPSKTKKGAFF